MRYICVLGEGRGMRTREEVEIRSEFEGSVFRKRERDEREVREWEKEIKVCGVLCVGVGGDRTHAARPKGAG